MSFIKDLVKLSYNEYANIVSEGVATGDVDSFIDSEFLCLQRLIEWVTIWWSAKQNHCNRR